jgi:ankyrin repeat protein
MEYNDLENQVGGANIRRALPLVTRPFTSYDRQLLDAITPGNVNEVNRLLNLGANPNVVSEKTSKTPLLKAFNINDLPIIRRLLQGGADPNFRFKNHWSIFKIAFEIGTNRPCNFEVINEMITHGRVNINEGDSRDNPYALYLAIEKNCLNAISLLLRQGVDLSSLERLANPIFREGNPTYWMSNISREAATILLDNGLNITLYNCFGKDDPMWKMFRNILIDRLTNVNLILKFYWVTGESRQLLLDYAVLTNDVELVNILLQKGADPNITTSYQYNKGLLDNIDRNIGGNYETPELRNRNIIRISQMLTAAGAIRNPINRRQHTYTFNYVTRYLEDNNGFLTLNPIFSNPQLDIDSPPPAPYSPPPPPPLPPLPPAQVIPSVPDFIISELPTLENFNSLKAKVECSKCHINLKKVILNCGHAFCETCTNSLQNCSICNTPIMKKQTIHKKYLFNNL